MESENKKREEIKKQIEENKKGEIDFTRLKSIINTRQKNCNKEMKKFDERRINK